MASRRDKKRDKEGQAEFVNKSRQVVVCTVGSAVGLVPVSHPEPPLFASSWETGLSRNVLKTSSCTCGSMIPSFSQGTRTWRNPCSNKSVQVFSLLSKSVWGSSRRGVRGESLT